LSIQLECDRDRARAAFDGLRHRGIVPTGANPVIRAAPVPF